MLTNSEKSEILLKAKEWFNDEIVQSHILNTVKLKNITEFNVNPFLISYLATFLSGEITTLSLAKALIYPRVLGTSITTSFGSRIQGFVTKVLSETFGSTTPGIDIEFIDQLDNRKKYCQVKLGPTTINKDDVQTLHSHFQSLKNLARTNHVELNFSDLYVAVLYGEKNDISAFYKRLETEHFYTLVVGQDFWHRLTGDQNFYFDLLNAISEINFDTQSNLILNETIVELSNTPELKNLVQHLNNKPLLPS